MKLQSILFVALVLMGSPRSVASELDSIQMMVDGFGGKCSINGEWTQLAMQNINSLVSVLESVKDDAACKSAASALNNLRASTTFLNEFNQPNSSLEIRINGLRSEQAEILNLISVTTDAGELAILNSSLLSSHLQLAELRGQRDYDNENRAKQRLQHASSMLAGTMQDVLSQLAENQRCWDDRPALLSTVAGLGASISQSVALGVGTGGLSTIIGAGVQLGAELINYIKLRKWQKRVAKIARPSQITALNCAMETMIANWCDARDVLKSVELVANSQFAKNPTDGKKSLRLLDRELPKLNSWLEQVRIGSTPANGAVALRLGDLFDREAALKKAKPVVAGLINEEISNFVGSERDLWNVEKKVVLKIIQTVWTAQGRVLNPMTDLYSSTVAPYILVGLTENQIPRTTSGTVFPFSVFLPGQFSSGGGQPAMPNIEINSDSLKNIVENRFLEWFQRANQRFQLQKQSILFDDPERIFTNAEKISLIGPKKKLSAKLAVRRLVKFLEPRRPKNNGAYKWMINIYDDTLRRLRIVLKVIESVNQPRTAAEIKMCAGGVPIQARLGSDAYNKAIETRSLRCPLEGLQRIEQNAKLENGVTFLSDRIEDLLRIIIEDEMINSKSLNRNQNLQYMAADDLVRRLLQFSGRKSWQSLVGDAKNSQRLAQSSIVGFSEAFSRQIKESFEMLDDHIKTFDEGPDGPSRYIKTEFCLNMMSLPGWKHFIGLRRCYGVKRASVIPDAPQSPEFNKKDFSKDFAERICNFHDYKRKIDIIQSFGPAEPDDE